MNFTLQLDHLKFPNHFLSYFQSVDFTVGAHNQTFRHCSLASSKHLNTYLVIRNETRNDHLVQRNGVFEDKFDMYVLFLQQYMMNEFPIPAGIISNDIHRVSQLGDFVR